MGFDLSCLDPLSWAANAVCGLLNDCGVPKTVTDGIEAGAAIVFCDPVLGIQAAKNLVADCQAQTEINGGCNTGYDQSHKDLQNPGLWRTDEFDCGDGLEDILNDPTLSTESKIEAVLSQCMKATDDQINQTLGQLDAASQNGGNNSGTSVQDLQVKLQQLIQQRQEMFTMMTDASKTYHDMSMTAINNMKG